MALDKNKRGSFWTTKKWCRHGTTSQAIFGKTNSNYNKIIEPTIDLIRDPWE
jgi:hypothetical protein